MRKKLLIFAVMLGFVGKVMADNRQGVTFEFWFGIDGTAVSDLTGQNSYPNNPDKGEIRDSFNGPVDWRDNYGTRARGYLNPPSTGDYTFWIASDDASELWLSTDDNPDNAVLIASVSGWTSAQDWDGTTGAPGPDQMSEPIPLEGGEYYYIEALMKEGDGGDNLAVAWKEPNSPERTVIDGAHVYPAYWALGLLKASSPSPDDGDSDIPDPVTLKWNPGKDTLLNYVYFSTIEADVEARKPNSIWNITDDASSDTGTLHWSTTYYWAVDELTSFGETVPGSVWSFSTERYVSILTGSKTLTYDNSAEPYFSELAVDTPADLTAGGAVSDLTLNFQGMGSNMSIDEETGTYMVTGEGADIWGSTDAFHYVYMQLTGDGEISARVVSNGTGSNTWAKGGVMIRETTAANSKHMIMAMTGGDGGGIVFQGRAETGGNSSGLQGGPVVAPPTYIKIKRTGNDISGYYSADGETWELFNAPVDDSGGFGIANPVTIDFPETVLIGLFVTSHADGENRTFTFDNLDIQGDVDGVLVSEDIDSVSGNSAEPVYVALEDVNGVVAMVTHPYLAATQIAANRPWTIPLSAFEGVDPTKAVKLYVGVGDGEPGGKGVVTFSDIKVVKLRSDGNIIWVSDGSDYNADGAPDDMEWVDILNAEGYSIDYSAGAGLGDGYWRTLDDDKIAALNAADLIIVSRNSNSAEYANDATEITKWNSIPTPMISSSTYLIRSSRWNWVNSESIHSLTPEMVQADGTVVPAIDTNIGPSSFIDADPGNGTVLATGDGLTWITEWEAGMEFYDGAGQFAGGPRMFFVAGTQETVPEIGRGEMNLTTEGQQIFLNAIDSMLSRK